MLINNLNIPVSFNYFIVKSFKSLFIILTCSILYIKWMTIIRTQWVMKVQLKQRVDFKWVPYFRFFNPFPDGLYAEYITHLKNRIEACL